MMRIYFAGRKLLLVFGFPLCAVLAAQTTSAPQKAQEPSSLPPAARGPDLAAAVFMAQMALDVCKTKGYLAAVSVVDSDGGLKVTLVADGFRGTPVISQKKAATAIHFRLSGAELEEKMKSDSAMAAEIGANAIYNAHPGSLLLFVGIEAIGAIGITGTPHDVGDACLRPAIERFQKRR